MLKTISPRIKKAGVVREKVHRKFYEIINRSFGNYKIIKLQSNDKDILDDFSKASYSNAQSNILNQTLSQIPRLFLESLLFIRRKVIIHFYRLLFF